jgi:hypothetical protein
MSRLLRFAAPWLLGFAASSCLAQSAPVEPGSPLRFTLQGNSFANALHVDVPAGAREMRLSLDSLTPNRDVDLLLRQGSAFPSIGSDGLAPDADWLFDHAQYRSVSATGQEYVVVTESSAVPLAPGRWHIAALSFASDPAEVELRVEFANQPSAAAFVLDFNAPSDTCNVAPWNDSTPRQPVPGNEGTTLGQQRRLALQETVRLIAEELRPAVGARIRACWQDLGGSANSLTLAQAGPSGYWLTEFGEGLTGQFLPERHTVYSRAAAVKLAGTDFCRLAGGNCGSHDLTITFNTRVEDSDTLNGWGFTYGTTRQNLSQIDFVAVAMHEVVHGLGFVGLVRRTGPSESAPEALIGDRLFPWDDAFTRYVRHTPFDGPDTGIPFFEVPREEREAVLTSINQLRFAGPASIASTSNPYNFMSGISRMVRLHAPASIASGSTLSHYSTDQGSQELMLASIPLISERRLSLAQATLFDVGWSRAPRSPRQISLPESIQYYDITRSGHGIDLQKVRGLDNLYFTTVYTFDAAGNPEWYVTVGPVVDGVFMPARNANGDSLTRFLYNPDGPPFQIADASPDFNGQLRIDFVDAAIAPACRETRDDRSGTLAVMSWTLGDGASEFDQWCVSPIIGDANRAEVDFSGTWYAGPTDSGWGFSVQSFRAGANDGLAFALYYADPEGRPQWAIAQSANYVPGAPMQLRRLSGYCRTCERPAGALQETVVGTVSIELFEPGQGQDRVSFDIDQGNGQRFVRELVPIIPVNNPRYRTTP